VRLVLYTGKGGVGKTTTAAATAACAAARGTRTLVASADSAHSLGDVLELRLGPKPIRVAENLDAIEIDARVEMIRHWGTIRDFLVEVLRHQGIEGVVAEELAMLPGAEEVTTLLAVEEYAGRYDFIVVDCAPTDSTLRLVTLPEVAHRALRLLLPLMQAVSSVGAPLARRFVDIPLPGSEVFRDAETLIYDKLKVLRQRIGDPETSIRLVLTPERMVIDETRRAHTELTLFEVACDAVVLNRLLPEAVAGEEFFADWSRLQQERRQEVEALFAPLPLLLAPLREDEVTGLASLAQHGQELFASHDPAAVLAARTRVRFGRDDDGYFAVVPLPGARAADLGVVKIEDELVITSGTQRRALALPRRIAPLPVARARVEGPDLIVRFGSGADAGARV